MHRFGCRIPNHDGSAMGGGERSTASANRLSKELERLKKEGVDGILIDFDRSSVRNWRAYLEGPESTPFAGGMFECTLDFPHEYPFKPPVVKFVTKMFHPNVYTSGDICLDILQDQWQPTYTGRTTLLSIQSLFTDPNPASSANGKAGNMYCNNRKNYDKEVVKFTQKYAMGKEAMQKKAQLGAKRKRDDGGAGDAESAAKKRKLDEEAAAKKKKAEEEKKKAEEAEAARLAARTPEEKMIDELKAEGFDNIDLIRALLPIVSGDKELLKSLYQDQQE